MKKIIIYILTITLLFACRKPEATDEADFDARLSGGENTVFDRSSRAYTHAFPNLSGRDMEVHELGDKGFEDIFVSAPSPLHNGLGPIYNNVSCVSCHHNDGTGIPTAGESQSSLLFRVSIGQNPDGSAIALPGYGTQLQDKSVFGKAPECNMLINYVPAIIHFPDGNQDTIWTPFYTGINYYTPVGPYALSPRLAPPVFGLGLLEAIDESTLLSFADPSDRNGDGISGKLNYVWDPISHSKKPGRFGLKASAPSLLVQVAGAYNQDMGITNMVFSEESSRTQDQYDNLNDDTEVPDSLLQAVKFYVLTLAVPARREVTDPVVIRGEALFNSLQCASCHIPTMHTKVNVAQPYLSNQRIHPYTDMLLHDMGAGLADDRPDFDADGREWRTSPLWGIGLRDVVNYPAYYLHDGRARSLTQAILWHGGEAKNSLDLYKQLSKNDRDAILKFLKTL